MTDLTVNPSPRDTLLATLRDATAASSEARSNRVARRRAWKADPVLAFREAAETVAGPGWWMQNVTVRKMLGWLPAHGPTRVRRVANRIKLLPASDPTLAELTPLKRAALVEYLRERLEEAEAAAELAGAA